MRSLCSCNHAQLPESPKSRRARVPDDQANQHASKRRAIGLNNNDSRIAVPAVIASSTSITRPCNALPTRLPPSPWSFASLRLKQYGRSRSSIAARQCHSGCGGNRDPFVSRAKQQIELNAGIANAQRKNSHKRCQSRPVLNSPALKKWGLPPGFQRKLAKL